MKLNWRKKNFLRRLADFLELALCGAAKLPFFFAHSCPAFFWHQLLSSLKQSGISFELNILFIRQSNYSRSQELLKVHKRWFTFSWLQSWSEFIRIWKREIGATWVSICIRHHHHQCEKCEDFCWGAVDFETVQNHLARAASKVRQTAWWRPIHSNTICSCYRPEAKVYPQSTSLGTLLFPCLSAKNLDLDVLPYKLSQDQARPLIPTS